MVSRFSRLEKALGQAKSWLLESSGEEPSRVNRFRGATQEIRVVGSGFVFCFFGLEIGRYVATSWFNAAVGDVLGAFFGLFLGIALLVALYALMQQVKENPQSYRNEHRRWWRTIAVPVYLLVTWLSFDLFSLWGAERGVSPWIGYPIYILGGLAVADTCYWYFSGPAVLGVGWFLMIGAVNLLVVWLHPGAFDLSNDLHEGEEYQMLLMTIGIAVAIAFLSYYGDLAIAWFRSRRTRALTEEESV